MQLVGGNPRGRGGAPRPHRSPSPRPFRLHLRHREAEGLRPPQPRGGAPAGPHAPGAPRGRDRAPRSPPPRARVRAGALRPEPRRHRRGPRAEVREVVVPEATRPVPFSAPAAIPRAWRTRRVAVPRLANPALFASAVFPVVDGRSRFVCYLRGSDLLRLVLHRAGGLVEALAAHLGAGRRALGPVRALAWLPHAVEPRAGVLGELLLHGDFVGDGRAGIAVAEQDRDALALCSAALQGRGADLGGAASVDEEALLDRGVAEQPGADLHPDLGDPHAVGLDDAIGLGHLQPDDAVGLGHLQPEDAVGLDQPHLDVALGINDAHLGVAVGHDQPHLDAAPGLNDPHLGVPLDLDHPHHDGELELAVAAQEHGDAAADGPPQVGDGLDYERYQIRRLYKSLEKKRELLLQLGGEYLGIMQDARDAGLPLPDHHLLSSNLKKVREVLKSYAEVKSQIEPFRTDMQREGAAPPEPPVALARSPEELLPAGLLHRRR